ncbi:hypothetical protein KCH_40110 [Kitasatospora cheerisanensis KCTC 2395]|uniref:Uncharacterized protein n=1 Tax=Kitasatospora cheerisanensis KCTC 2395 TaxID=1348663 RepID=A0A066Z253_9ACTN|nr:hypothetical protein KCH_40110 [Kitasatospora cheerisanensis KCTC 2395]
MAGDQFGDRQGGRSGHGALLTGAGGTRLSVTERSVGARVTRKPVVAALWEHPRRCAPAAEAGLPGNGPGRAFPGRPDERERALLPAVLSGAGAHPSGRSRSGAGYGMPSWKMT